MDNTWEYSIEGRRDIHDWIVKSLEIGKGKFYGFNLIRDNFRGVVNSLKQRGYKPIGTEEDLESSIERGSEYIEIRGMPCERNDEITLEIERKEFRDYKKKKVNRGGDWIDIPMVNPGGTLTLPASYIVDENREVMESPYDGFRGGLALRFACH